MALSTSRGMWFNRIGKGDPTLAMRNLSCTRLLSSICNRWKWSWNPLDCSLFRFCMERTSRMHKRRAHLFLVRNVLVEQLWHCLDSRSMTKTRPLWQSHPCSSTLSTRCFAKMHVQVLSKLHLGILLLVPSFIVGLKDSLFRRSM